MFEVLVFVYENFWGGESYPDFHQLERKLSAHGFEPDEIQQALIWLDGLNLAAESTTPEEDSPQAPSAHSLRVYSPAEQDHLGAECLGFVSFLESAGVLPAPMREIAVDRAMATPGTLALEDLKIIVLMVFWSMGEEPDALILDELFVDAEDRLIH